MDLAEISTITPYTISHEAGGGNASSFLPVAVPPVVDPEFRLRGRNFKHAPRIVLSRPSREIDFSADPPPRMYRRMQCDADGGDTERGIDFFEVSMYCFGRGI